MFLRYIKDIGLKKIVRKRLANYKPVQVPGVINTVGIIINETYFKEKELLVKELVKKGIQEKNIQTLSFKERLGKKEFIDCCYYTRRDIALNGSFTKEDVVQFLNTPFDMLINYYDVDSLPLMLATLSSEARLRVGFATVDNRLNDFMISMQAEKYSDFIAELFKYLKILKKI